MALIGEYLAADLRTAVPILLAGLGLLLVNRAGLLNIGAEGIMLMATLMAVLGSYWTGSVWMGLLLAMLVGGLLGLLFAFLTVSLRANQIIIGAAFNILAAGLSATLNRVIFGVTTDINVVDTFRPLHIPLLCDIPILGPGLWRQTSLVYIAFLLVPAGSLFLFKTAPGLSLRSVGENPKAADTLGINVYAVRYGASIVGGVFMAMAGAFLSTGLLSSFSEDMVSGRGYIALAAVIFGRYKPLGVMLASLLFAAGNVAANILQAQNAGIPYNLLVMIPYLLTIVALAGFTGRVAPPAAAGKPYKKG